MCELFKGVNLTLLASKLESKISCLEAPLIMQNL